MTHVHDSGRRSGSASTASPVQLLEAEPENWADLGRRLQTAFTLSAQAATGTPTEEPIPSDGDIRASFRAENAEVLHVVATGVRIGGAVVSVDAPARRGSLDFFFLDPDQQGAGQGLAAWRAVERRYPDVELWETMTPYFETRNIHFYVNKCGFQIVEFFHSGHPDPHSPHRSSSAPGDDVDRNSRDSDDDLMFRFEKRIAPRTS